MSVPHSVEEWQGRKFVRFPIGCASSISIASIMSVAAEEFPNVPLTEVRVISPEDNRRKLGPGFGIMKRTDYQDALGLTEDGEHSQKFSWV